MLLIAFIQTVLAATPPVQEGVIIDSSIGDTACYLDIQDAKKETYSVDAGFELCEPHYKGKQVKLQWEEANVLAADCNGDMDCGRFETINLVGSATPVWTISSKDVKDGVQMTLTSGTVKHQLKIPKNSCSTIQKNAKADEVYRATCNFGVVVHNDPQNGLVVTLEVDTPDGVKKQPFFTEGNDR